MKPSSTVDRIAKNDLQLFSLHENLLAVSRLANQFLAISSLLLPSTLWQVAIVTVTDSRAVCMRRRDERDDYVVLVNLE